MLWKKEWFSLKYCGSFHFFNDKNLYLKRKKVKRVTVNQNWMKNSESRKNWCILNDIHNDLYKVLEVRSLKYRILIVFIIISYFLRPSCCFSVHPFPFMFYFMWLTPVSNFANVWALQTTKYLIRIYNLGNLFESQYLSIKS